MQPKYDVAISFLSGDEAIAAALYNALSDGLEVFFYPRSQEALAGTNGLESMRGPFLDESRIIVVLYQEPWGKTPWTQVEQTAIQEACLKDGWHRLFFMGLDKTSVVPAWVPNTHVRYNYADFGLEQAVGAIKARVQEVGGTIAPLTAIKRAELSKRETQYTNERRRLRFPTGREIVRQKTSELFDAIGRLCAEINASRNAEIQFASDAQQCHLRNGQVSLLVTLGVSYAETTLVIREFDERLPLGNENLFYPDGQPKALRERRLVPDMNRAREAGWMDQEKPDTFLSTGTLADRIVSMFVDLAAKADRGEL